MLREASCIPQHAIARHDGLRGRPLEMVDPIEDCPQYCFQEPMDASNEATIPMKNRWSRMCVVRCDPLQKPVLYTIGADYIHRLVIIMRFSQRKFGLSPQSVALS